MALLFGWTVTFRVASIQYKMLFGSHIYHSCLAADATGRVGINTMKYYWQHSYMLLLKIVIATMFDYIGYIGNFLITLQTTSVWSQVSHAKFTSIQFIPLLFSSQ